MQVCLAVVARISWWIQDLKIEKGESPLLGTMLPMQIHEEEKELRMPELASDLLKEWDYHIDMTHIIHQMKR